MWWRSHSALLLALLLCGCARERMGDCFTGKGPRTSETRTVEPFTAIALADRIDVVLTQDSLAPHEVTVEGGRNLLEAVVTEVRDGVLYISDEMRCNWVRPQGEQVTVHVRMPLLERIDYTGLGDISATGPLRASVFRLEQYGGQGHIRLHLEVDTCHAGMHTGSGAVQWTGTADVAYLYAARFSPIDLQGLEAREVHVNSQGTGDFRCRARDALFVRIGHTGDVYFAGAPPLVEATITGSGQLIPVD